MRDRFLPLIRWGLARSLARASLLAFLLAAGAAHASFHLWTIDQIYSDATGNVQYIRFSALAGGQQFLSGHDLVSARSGSTSRTLAFTTNLPGDSGGKKFLVGTQGFAALNLVTPDYVVPNGFLFKQGGTITFAGGADTVTYPALPTSGNQAVNHSGAIVAALPTNFAGPSAAINVPPPTQKGALDIDRNGVVDALTDGLLLFRYAFGLRGDALIAGAIGAGAARTTADEIEAYLAACVLQTGVTC